MRRITIVALIGVVALAGAQTSRSADGVSLTIVSPTRGAFLSGSPNITVEGTAPNAQSVEVNGRSASLSGSDWSIPVTLGFGVNTFVARAFDQQGAVTETSWSVLYSPTYLPGAQPIPNAAAERLSPAAVGRLVPAFVNALTGSGALQQAIVSVPQPLPGRVSFTLVSFASPHAVVTPVQNGFRTAIDFPDLAAGATFAGGTLDFTATNAHVDMTLLISVANGRYVVSMSVTPTVRLTGFNTAFVGQPAGLVQRALAEALQTALPPVLTSELNQAVAPRSVKYLNTQLLLVREPRSLSIDPSGVAATSDANLTVAGNPIHTGAPGSISRTGATAPPPPLQSPPDVSLSLREDLLNRALFTAWEAGAWDIRIDQSFLAAQGINLPFPLDSSLLVPFFPALQGILPPGNPVPIAFDLTPELPPVLIVGQPAPLTLEFGELHVSLLVDFAGGYQPILELALHVSVPVSPTLLGDRLAINLAESPRLATDVLQNPLDLSPIDVDRFLQLVTPSTVLLQGGLIQPIPIPSFVGGLPSLTSPDIRQDGAGADFLTIEGDL